MSEDRERLLDGLDEGWASVEHDLPQLRSHIAALVPPEAIE